MASIPRKYRRMIRFLVGLVLFYLAWLLIYDGFIKEKTTADYLLTRNITALSTSILNGLGMEVDQYDDGFEQYIYTTADEKALVKVAHPCNGLVIYVFYAAFILFYPGSWKRKILYLILGIASIYLLNVVRIVVLALIARSYPELLPMAHKYVFSLIIYGWVFLLWIRFSRNHVPAVRRS